MRGHYDNENCFLNSKECFMNIDRNIRILLLVAVVVVIVLFVLRGCDKIQFKHKGNDDKSKFSLEIDKAK